MTDKYEDAGSPNVKLVNGRLRLTGVQQLLLLRILEDSLRQTSENANWSNFCYTHEFRKELYDDIIAQQDDTII